MDRGCPARDTVSSLGALQATVVARPLLALHGPSKPLPTLATASEATKRSPLSNPPESLVDTTPVSGEALRVSAAVCTEGKAFHVSLFSPLIISVTHFFAFIIAPTYFLNCHSKWVSSECLIHASVSPSAAFRMKFVSFCQQIPPNPLFSLIILPHGL